MKVVPHFAIERHSDEFRFYPLDGDGEIMLAAELTRLSPRCDVPVFYPGEIFLVTHLWPEGNDAARMTFSLAAYAATV